jgi:hypothetical protein
VPDPAGSSENRTSEYTPGSHIFERSTEVVIRHERIASAAMRDDHARGWAGCLDGLAALVTSEPEPVPASRAEPA